MAASHMDRSLVKVPSGLSVRWPEELHGHPLLQMKGPRARGPFIRHVLGLRRSSLVLGECLAGLGSNLRGNDPRRVLGLSLAGVLLAEPSAQHLRVDAEFGSELLGGIGLRSSHSVTSLRAFGVCNVHDAIVSHMATALCLVQGGLHNVYKPQTGAKPGGLSARWPRRLVKDESGLPVRGPRHHHSKKERTGSGPPLESVVEVFAPVEDKGRGEQDEVGKDVERGEQDCGVDQVVDHGLEPPQDQFEFLDLRVDLPDGDGVPGVGCEGVAFPAEGDEAGVDVVAEFVVHGAFPSVDVCDVCDIHVNVAHIVASLRRLTCERLARSVRRLRVNRPRSVLRVRSARVMLAQPPAQRLRAHVQLLREIARRDRLRHVVTPFRVFVVHNVIIAHDARMLCNGCVNCTHTSASIERGNDVACQSFTRTMLERFNHTHTQASPLPVREGGIDAVFVWRGAEREGPSKVAGHRAAYGVAHVA